MQPSFQSSTYNHSLQTQILGPSSLKIFAGEDLSIYCITQLVETANDYSKYNQISGGNNKKKKNRKDKEWNKPKKSSSTNRPCKSTSIENNSNNKNKKD